MKKLCLNTFTWLCTKKFWSCSFLFQNASSCFKNLAQEKSSLTAYFKEAGWVWRHVVTSQRIVASSSSSRPRQKGMNVTKIVASQQQQPQRKIHQSLGRKIKKRELPIYLENWPPSFQSSKLRGKICLVNCFNIASKTCHIFVLWIKDMKETVDFLYLFLKSRIKQELFMHSTIMNTCRLFELPIVFMHQVALKCNLRAALKSDLISSGANLSDRRS